MLAAAKGDTGVPAILEDEAVRGRGGADMAEQVAGVVPEDPVEALRLFRPVAHALLVPERRSSRRGDELP